MLLGDGRDHPGADGLAGLVGSARSSARRASASSCACAKQLVERVPLDRAGRRLARFAWSCSHVAASALRAITPSQVCLERPGDRVRDRSASREQARSLRRATCGSRILAERRDQRRAEERASVGGSPGPRNKAELRRGAGRRSCSTRRGDRRLRGRIAARTGRRWPSSRRRACWTSLALRVGRDCAEEVEADRHRLIAGLGKRHWSAIRPY